MIFSPVPVESIYVPATDSCIEPYTYEDVVEILLADRLDEVEILAHLINAECGSSWCTYEMRYLTGSVVINRMASDLFPNTLEEVVNQTGQYSCATYYMDLAIYDDSIYEVAKELLVFGTDAPDNLVFQAQFKQGTSVYKCIGNQYYCLLDKE